MMLRCARARRPGPDERPWLVLGFGGGETRRPRGARRGDGARPEARWATVVHATAWVSPSATLEPGPSSWQAGVNAGARVGRHAIVNSGAVVEHDVLVGAFAHVGPGAVIGGGARIGEDAFVGLGARVRDHIGVGDGAVVGMGAVVVDDVPGRPSSASRPRAHEPGPRDQRPRRLPRRRGAARSATRWPPWIAAPPGSRWPSTRAAA